jgi:hypothetical protein
MLGHNNGAMINLRTPLSLNIPILDGSDDVALIERTQHYFDFIIRLRIPHKKIDAATNRLPMFTADDL